MTTEAVMAVVLFIYDVSYAIFDAAIGAVQTMLPSLLIFRRGDHFNGPCCIHLRGPFCKSTFSTAVSAVAIGAASVHRHCPGLFDSIY